MRFFPCQAHVLGIVVLCAVTCVPVGAFANFKYIAPGQTESSAAQAPAPVSSMPLSRSGLGPASQGVAASHEMSGGDIISGFGTQVPLVMALREVVPSSYQFAFAEGLNLGTLVNWKGGRPWRDVLRSVLTPLGLAAAERSSVIYVDHADALPSAR